VFYKTVPHPAGRVIENETMAKRRDDIDVIEYVPKRQGLFRPWVVVLLIAAWVVVLIAALMLKITMLRTVLPVLMFVLLVYLFVCTIVALRRK
jgi:hypothetical protein